MDFEDQEEHDEEIVLPPSYDSLGNSGRAKLPSPISVDAPSSTAARKPRYRECLKNHAVGIGGQAVDGCGEFMAAGAEGSLDALKCAACNCHRNFHRKETEGGGGGGGFNVPQLLTYPHHHNHNHNHHPHHQQFSPTFYRSTSGYLHVAHHQRPLALPSTSGGGGGGGGGGGSQGGGGEEEEDMLSNPSNNNNMSNIMSRKRHRTKFTQEQKEKMMCLAEKLGWRIQKEDDALIQQFSDETGVKRHVLKVWMHNNKHTLGAKKP